MEVGWYVLHTEQALVSQRLGVLSGEDDLQVEGPIQPMVNSNFQPRATQSLPPNQD